MSIKKKTTNDGKAEREAIETVPAEPPAETDLGADAEAVDKGLDDTAVPGEQEPAGEPVSTDSMETEVAPETAADEVADAPETNKEGEPLTDEPVDEPGEASDGKSQPIGINARSVIEAVLFATDEPVTPHKLVDIVGVGNVRDVKGHIKALNQKYSELGMAFRIEHIADGYLMLTLSEFNPWLSKLLKVRSESKITPAGLETLAIIAYKQPIMRAEIENIRGVAAGEMVRQLVEKGLVKIVGRAEELGRPLLYGTTRKFLEVFGLGSLKDLPNAEDDKKRRLEAGESVDTPEKEKDADDDEGPLIRKEIPASNKKKKKADKAPTPEPDNRPESPDEPAGMELDKHGPDSEVE